MAFTRDVRKIAQSLNGADGVAKVHIRANLTTPAITGSLGVSSLVDNYTGSGKPQFTNNFAEAQRRLLGPTILCAQRKNVKKSNIYVDTANLILEIRERYFVDSNFRDLCKKEAKLRLGNEGGTKRIAKSIDHLISK